MEVRGDVLLKSSDSNQSSSIHLQFLWRGAQLKERWLKGKELTDWILYLPV